ncbi:MAG: hypothetical protein KBD53_02030, partial [Candidatus Omnitrophica bacterium]|nr:hypothetical protein [Candidatus Omnitrophota bacterium]
MLIGAIVISIVSVAAWTGFSSLQIAEEQTRNRTTATNLLQLSQEEVRNFAQNTADFDRLETCHFPPATPDCNLSDPTSTTPFSGFTRTMTAAQENSSPELKRVHTVVQWTERGSAQQMESVILLSRPGTSIPGNLIGIVSSTAAPGTPLNLTTVKLTSTTSTATYTTNSSGSLGSKNANYDFMDPVTGKYLVPAGAYTLTANRTGYQPYTYGSPINIPSSGEIRKDFELTPVPADAVIHGTITGGLTTFNYGQIWLYENGAPAVGVIPNPPVVSNSTSYSFTIPFSAPGTTRSFTIATIGSWKQGYVYDLRLGTSCSLEYSANGYSTAWVSAGGGVNCDPVTHPYLGNSGSDRIMVGPGVNRTEDLPLVPIPEVTLTGTVKDNLGDPIIGATVLVMWPASGGVEPPNWYRYWRYRKNGAFACNPSFAPCDPDKFNTKTVAGGRFSINVPAVQGVAPNITPAQNYLQVSIGANLPSTLCCGQTVPTPVGQNFNLPWPVILGGNLPGSLFPTTGSFDLGTVKLSP